MLLEVASVKERALCKSTVRVDMARSIDAYVRMQSTVCVDMIRSVDGSVRMQSTVGVAMIRSVDGSMREENVRGLPSTNLYPLRLETCSVVYSL